jgi:hypothetical protein
MKVFEAICNEICKRLSTRLPMITTILEPNQYMLTEQGSKTSKPHIINKKPQNECFEPLLFFITLNDH